MSESRKASNASKDQAASFAPQPQIRALWDAVHDSLRGEFGEAVFRSWLKPLALQACYHGTLEVSVPTRFMRDWIQNHYAGRVLQMCAERDGDIKRLEIVVAQTASGQAETAPPPKKSNQNAQRDVQKDSRALAAADEALGLSSSFDPRFTFDSFVVRQAERAGPCRGAARSSSRRERAVQPAVPVWRRRPRQDPPDACDRAGDGGSPGPASASCTMSAEKFMYQFVRALKAKDTMAFKEAIRGGRRADDRRHPVHLPARNRRRRNSSTPSTRWSIRTSRSSSPPTSRPRTCWGSRSACAPASPGGWSPTSIPRPTNCASAFCRRSALQLGAEVPDAVLEFLALKITSNIRELEGALNRIVAHADVTRRQGDAGFDAGRAAGPAAQP